MRRWPLLLAFLAAGAPDALAQTQNIATSGAWRAYGGRSETGTPVCGMAVQGRDRAMHIKYFLGGDRLVMQVFKDTWQVPRGQRVPIRFGVNGATSWSANAVGNARMIEWTIPQTLIPDFEAAFRNGQAMRIEFASGNEPAWSASLSGSGDIASTFVACMRRINAEGAGQAGTPATPTQPFAATPTTPTQPFAAAPTAPTQPFAPAPSAGGSFAGPSPGGWTTGGSSSPVTKN